jgi:hypothetical protein
MGAKENGRANGGRKVGRVERLNRQKPTEPRGRGGATAPEPGNTKAPVQQKTSPAKPAPQPSVQSAPSQSMSEPAVAPDPAPTTAPKATPPGQLKLLE